MDKKIAFKTAFKKAFADVDDAFYDKYLYEIKAGEYKVSDIDFEGVEYHDVKFEMSEERKRAVQDFIRDHPAFYMVEIYHCGGNYQATAGFSPDGSLTQLVKIGKDDDDPIPCYMSLEEAQKDLPLSACTSNIHVVEEGDVVHMLRDKEHLRCRDRIWETETWDYDQERFEHLIYIWMECYIANVPLFTINMECN